MCMTSGIHLRKIQSERSQYFVCGRCSAAVEGGAALVLVVANFLFAQIANSLKGACRLVSNMQPAELKCMDPEQYRNFFRALCWSNTRKVDTKMKKKVSKKERLRRMKSLGSVPTCYAPAILTNPSHFGVYANVRRLVLDRWMHLPGAATEQSDDSEDEESTAIVPVNKLPKRQVGFKQKLVRVGATASTSSVFVKSAWFECDIATYQDL